ncbi:MAG: sugar phosphate isomerase/epimerase [Planctomycetes bacterium]|nr:sugar phosphate isomerase/epimerase [Planctomycetota bacterium]
MKPKLSCADFTFPLLPHSQQLDLVAMLGFEAVDIGLFEGRSRLWPSNEFCDLRRSAQLLKRKLGDRGLKAADVYLQTDPDFVPYAANHPDSSRRRKARDWFVKTLEYAIECGASHVTTLPGASFEGVPYLESFRRCCEEMAWRVDCAADAGIPFGIEAHFGSIIPRPKSTLQLLQAVPGLTLTLDYTHFVYVDIAAEEIEPLLSHATHFHARGACRDRIQCSFQRSTIDYDRVLQEMERVGYRGHICVEYVWIDWEHCNETDNLSETILFRNFFQRECSPQIDRTFL